MLLEHEGDYGLGMDVKVMLLEHEGDYGLGMDAMVTVCSWNTNEIMVLYPPTPPPSPLQKSVQPHGLLQAPSPKPCLRHGFRTSRELERKQNKEGSVGKNVCANKSRTLKHAQLPNKECP